MEKDVRSTLLFVDDDPLILDALRRAFRKRYQILTADCGGEAMKILERTPIDLIICDQRMPDYCGTDVLKHALQFQPEAVRILLTGYSDVESLAACINEARVYQYITKPWQPEMVLMTVIRALEGLESQRNLRQTQRLLYCQKEALDRYALVFMLDEQGHIDYVNDSFCRLQQSTSEDLCGQHLRSFLTQHESAFFKQMWDVLTAGRQWQGVLMLQGKEMHSLNATIVPVMDEMLHRYVAICKPVRNGA